METSKKAAGATIVAGGSGAIGRAICRRLAVDGHDIALTYRQNAESGRAAEAEIRAAGRSALAASVALEDADEVQRFVERVAGEFGGVRCVVYAAGPHLDFTFISAITPQDWKRVMDSDVNGCFNLLSAALPHLRSNGSGAIVAVTTCATEKVPVQDILSAAPKVAIEMLVKGIAKEEGRYGIRANCVAPGFLTDGIGGQILAKDEKITEMLRRQVPMKRFGKAEDIASAISFLLSGDAGYISGQSLAVDGGFQL